MKRGKPTVFLSSTSDLANERAAVTKALRPLYEVYAYEEHHAGRASPEDAVRQQILESDVFLAVLGPAYGSTFSTTPHPRSIVEWEFDTATERRSLEIITFVQTPPAGAIVDPRQQTFLTRVTSLKGVWCKFFTSSTDLVAGVDRALTEWLVDFWGRIQESKRVVARWLHSILTGFTMLAIVSVIVVNVPPVRNLFTVTSRLAFCGISASIVVLCAMLMRTELGGRRV